MGPKPLQPQTAELFDEGWLYLAAVLDLHSRQVVGWSLQAHMQTALVKDALLMACFRRKPPAGLIFHSDRGSQYCSQDFQDTLTAWGIRSWMSRKGNCWDNAPTESLWGRLKTACVHGQRFGTRGQARQTIMDWIAFYNHSRLHSTLGYLSPMQFEQRWLAAQRNLPLDNRAMHSDFQRQGQWPRRQVALRLRPSCASAA